MYLNTIYLEFFKIFNKKELTTNMKSYIFVVKINTKRVVQPLKGKQ